MSEQSDWQILISIADNYIKMVRNELVERWDKWSLDLVKREMYEVIGGLLARQVTLATQLASAPSIWNGHIAPIILRTMVDTYISLAWIFDDPLDRAQKYILYGLGQEKLNLEYRKAALAADGIDSEKDPLVKATETWIDSQRYTFLTEVNVGSWSGKSTRDMANEAGCLDLYRYAYTPFSAATHSMWTQISKYNLVTCPNPLHGYHKIPIDSPANYIDPDYLYRAAKYVNKSFRLFDKKTGVRVNTSSALESLAKSLIEFNGNEAKTESVDKQDTDGDID